MITGLILKACISFLTYAFPAQERANQSVFQLKLNPGNLVEWSPIIVLPTLYNLSSLEMEQNFHIRIYLIHPKVSKATDFPVHIWIIQEVLLLPLGDSDTWFFLDLNVNRDICLWWYKYPRPHYSLSLHIIFQNFFDLLSPKAFLIFFSLYYIRKKKKEEEL